MKFKNAIYNRVTELANKSNLTLSQLAIKSGMTPSTLYQLKNNDTQIPTLITIKRLCDGLGITLSIFFDTDEINNSDFE
jgi:transcriptional regulator with XRE-family HTH domain